jgi:uncharacterized membrane protein YbhN (UPF0104 family)
MTNPLFEKIRKSLSKINWRKLGIIVLYSALGLTCAGILFLFIGLLVVGRPSAPAYEENPINVLATLGIFLTAGIAIYTFRGGGGNNR